MTVETTNSTISYTGNGSVTIFAYDFLTYSEDHLFVYLDDIFQGTGFSVSGVGEDDGGNITFDVAPLSGVDVRIDRTVPVTQEIEYQEYGPFSAKTNERGLDLGVMIDQQNERDAGRNATEKMDKQPTATERNIVIFDGEGNSQDSGFAIDDIDGFTPVEQARQAGDNAQTQFDTPSDVASSPFEFQVRLDGLRMRGQTDYTTGTIGKIDFTVAPSNLAEIDITWYKPLIGTDAVIVQEEISKLNPIELNDAVIDTTLNPLGGEALNVKERTTGNGGGAMWDVVLASSVTPNTSNIVQCTGVPTLALVLRLEGIANIREFGANPSLADNALFIQAAIDTLLPVRVPVGDYISTRITVYSETTIKGDHITNSKFILKDGANDYLIYSEDADSLWGTASVGGTTRVKLMNITFDGNVANNSTSLACVALYGDELHLENIVIQNTDGVGMRTEWGDITDFDVGLEGFFSNIRMINLGEHGWRNAGPHDSNVTALVIIDAGQKLDKTFSHLWCEKGGMKYSHSHFWTHFANLKSLYGVKIDPDAKGNVFTTTDFEGQATNLLINSQKNTFSDSCRYYAAWDGVNVLLRESSNIVKGYFDDPVVTRPASKGVIMGLSGDNVTGCLIDVMGAGQEAGFIDFTYSAGSNTVMCRGFNVAGVPVLGEPNLSDLVSVHVTGGTLYQKEQHTSPVNYNVAERSATGTDLASAVDISVGATMTVVISANGTNGVRLPSVNLNGNGVLYKISNVTGSACLVYPASGQNIAGLGVDNPLTLPALKAVEFFVSRRANGEWSHILSS